jgi:hypothetical protein
MQLLLIETTNKFSKIFFFFTRATFFDTTTPASRLNLSHVVYSGYLFVIYYVFHRCVARVPHTPTNRN